MSYRLHYFLREPAYTHILAFREDFLIVGALTTEGLPLLPFTASDPTYLVPLGVQGIPYVPGLRVGGEHIEFNFAAQVSVIAVLTGDYLPPTFVPVPPPARVTITSTALQGYSPRSSGSVVKVLNIQFSDGSSDNYSQNWRSATPPVGTPLDELEPRYAMFIYGGSVVPDNPFDPNGPKGPSL